VTLFFLFFFLQRHWSWTRYECRFCGFKSCKLKIRFAICTQIN
jgi:hypothetical protein